MPRKIEFADTWNSKASLGDDSFGVFSAINNVDDVTDFLNSALDKVLEIAEEKGWGSYDYTSVNVAKGVHYSKDDVDYKEPGVTVQCADGFLPTIHIYIQAPAVGKDPSLELYKATIMHAGKKQVLDLA